MQDNYSIKNFRPFDEKGVVFEFRPITLLTGCNGAGKSSLTKSIMLFQNFLNQGRRDRNDRTRRVFEPTKYNLDFSEQELKLGGFSKEIHRNSDLKEIGFSYSYFPSVAPLFEFTVDYWFRAVDNDKFNNGWLSRIEIRGGDATILKASVREKDGRMTVDYLNLNTPYTLQAFDRFFIIANVIHLNQLQNKCYDDYGDLVDKAEYDKLESIKQEFVDSFNGNLYQADFDGAKQFTTADKDYKREDYTADCPHLFDYNLLAAFKKSRENNLMFYFPIFEKLNGLSKEDICDCLENATLFIPKHDMGEGGNGIVEEIVNAFRHSDEDRFVDYFLNLENQKLNNLGEIDRPFYIRLEDEDLIHRILFCSSVSFDANQLFGTENKNVSFDKVYRFLCNWQWHETPETADDFFERSIESYEQFLSSHKLYSAYQEYVSVLLQELLLPKSFKDIHYLGNAHAGIKRLFSFEDRSDPYMIRINRYLTAVREYENALNRDSFRSGRGSRFQAGDFINGWVSKLELGQSLVFSVDNDSLGVKLLLKKNLDNGVDETINLADEGYGVNQVIGLLISIETEILLLKTDEFINERIPVIGQPEPTPYVLSPVTVIIEEPEVNLHPAFQSKLAEMFYEATSMFEGNKIHFVIETHSEYLVRKTQVMLVDPDFPEITPEKNVFSVYYINKDHSVKKMEYDLDGSFISPFGQGFFDEADNLTMELLKKNL